MRAIRGCLLFAAFGACALDTRSAETPAQEGGVRIIHTYTGWRDAASFKRISEYFDGKENTGGEIVLRTHPDQRGGYYFLVRIANPGAPFPSRIVLRIVTPDSATPRTFTFNPTLPAHDAVLELGLTGADWPDRKINAVAWRLDVFDDAGRMLATGKSYLWDKPAGE
jgi:hypothetical protein